MWLTLNQPTCWSCNHVVHERWSPGQPLKPWNMLVKEGVFEDSDWAHDRVRVGHDGDRVSLCEDLETAKFWRQKRPSGSFGSPFRRARLNSTRTASAFSATTG
jgi:hypothetical protein